MTALLSGRSHEHSRERRLARTPPPSSRVRWSKVKTAQARMAVGYYERLDVKEALLDAVIKELSRR